MSDYKLEDYVAYRMRKANETIAETTVLIENKYWNTAINRMYYACFYAVGALLVKHGVETSSHSGTRQKFGQLFILTGRISRELGKHYTELFEKRQKGDYNDFFDFDEDAVLKLYKPSKDFIKEIERLIKE